MSILLSDRAIPPGNAARHFAGSVVLALCSLGLAAGPVSASENGGAVGICSQTSALAHAACRAELKDDFRIARAICINTGDTLERQRCETEARENKAAAQTLCKDQYAVRLDVCDLVGEGRYDPDFDPASFLAQPEGNAYFPLTVGNHWQYQGTVANDDGEEVTETINVTVLSETKDIEGVTCLVVNDVVEEDGNVIEDTDDWYAQHRVTQDIWYCGEAVQDFETFDGDMPAAPERVSIDGSFKVGRDGDKPGILVRAVPQQGETYRQEFSLGNAEDIAQVLSTTYVFGRATSEPDSLDFLVPGDLASKYCSIVAPCLVTRDFSPLDPNANERKYYAPGIGMFLEVNLTTQEIVELVGCNLPGC